MARIAIIDLGTHTALLLVADVQGRRFNVIREEQRIVGLGRDIGKTGLIREDSAQAALAALQEYRTLIQSLGAEETRLVATAVLRDPANADAIKTCLEKGAGIPIRIISGEEEARLVFNAGVFAFPGPGLKTVIDIGGGSVEFVQGRDNAIARMKSLPLGAVKLTELFIRNFPTPPEELAALQGHLKQVYAEALADFHSETCRSVVGVAGTFTTAAAMTLGLKAYDPARITGALLSRESCAEWLRRIARLSIEEQRAIPGLHPKRAGYIVAGFALISSFFDLFGVREITVSDMGLRYGVLLDRMDESLRS